MKTISEYSNQIQNQLDGQLSLFGLDPIWSKLIVFSAILVGVFFVSYICLVISKRIIFHLIGKTGLSKRYHWIDTAHSQRVFRRGAHLIPGFIVQAVAPSLAIKSLAITALLSKFLLTASAVYLIITAAFVISALLNTVAIQYRFFQIAKQRPIKSYVQVAKIILGILTAVFVGSVILNRSPVYLLTGLGTMTAIIMLVFKDSLLGFVSSIQLAANDMVRIGDWIEMPTFGADGDVIDISLNTVKIQNWDKTIVTIPSYALLSHGVKNWRGMNEAGGRRIKRAIFIDVHTIHFCDTPFIEKLRQLPLLEERLDNHLKEMDEVNKAIGLDMKSEALQPHRITNLGAFRLYLESYLSKHPKIHRDLTFLVRQLQDTNKGIPIEIYIFTNDTNWIRYEAIQADIFEHIYAILPYFDLRPFQYMSGQKIQLDISNNPESLTQYVQATTSQPITTETTPTN